MLAGLLWNRWSFIILFTIIHFGCWYEFVKLLKKINPASYRRLSFWGLFYITIPIILLLFMRLKNYAYVDDNFLKIIPCVIIFSLWVNDTMAYIVGSFIGRTPLSKISPKKTWEGTIGGALLCIIVISLLGSFYKIYGRIDYMIISFLCAFFGTLGDLLESKLKRMANVKDSGTLMPGHGGFLDRFDSLLIATPFVALYYFILM
jgi:phosphatidate cytidylyltransferase